MTDFLHEKGKAMSKITKTNYTADRLWDTIEELKKLEDKPEIIRTWVSNSDITFKDKEGKEETIGAFYGRYFVDNGKSLGRDEVIQILSSMASKKEVLKEEFTEKDKNRATYGGAGFGFRGKPEEIKLNTSLIKTNNHDFDMFSNFRQCGSSLVLVDDGEVLLCVQDSRGSVKISAEKYLRGNIGRSVKDKFDIKFKMYWKKMNDFVANLQNMREDEVGLSPVEDFLSTEVPASMSKFLKLIDYQEIVKDGIGKNAKEYTKSHFKFELKNQIDHSDDVFQWTLDNWSKFTRAIHGQSKFYAWSNDRTVTASSYWDLPNDKVECPKSWQKFLKDKMSKHLMIRFVSYLGMVCDADNRCQQYLIISGTGGEGKDFCERLITNALPKNSVSNLDTTALANDDRFGLANREIWKSHLSIIHELNSSKNLQSEKAKQYFAQNTMDLEVKNAGVVTWEPINHKTIINSNTKISIKEYANRRRCIPIVFSNKLKWTQDLEDQMQEDTKQFLDFCYQFYKKCPLVKNGQYIVLCEEDEQKYLNGELDISIVDDRMSKRAFSEECLKDYYNTDEYTENDMVYDIYEPIIKKMFTITNSQNDIVENNDFKEKFKEVLKTDKNFQDGFGVRLDPNGDLYNFFPYKNSDYWKFTAYLKDKYDLRCTNNRVDGIQIRGWKGIKLNTDCHSEKEHSITSSFATSTDVSKVDEAMMNPDTSRGITWEEVQKREEAKNRESSGDGFTDMLV